MDFSHSGLDMILNSVALFFMLELDDMLVTEQDYLDCEEHLRNTLKNEYVPNVEINNEYMSMRKEIKSVNNTKESNSKNCKEKCCFGSCLLSSLYLIINAFSVFVTCICFLSGFIAPFVIFFCW